MLTLYGSEGAGSVAAEALLTHLGTPFELKLLDLEAKEEESAEFLAINPRGQIPVLVLEDESILTESLAIMFHIADSNPSSGLIPEVGSADRAQVYRWMSFLGTNVYEGFLRLFYADTYTTGSDTAGVEESADQYLHSAFEIINKALDGKPNMVGDRVGICDFYLAMLLTWYPDQAKLYEMYPNLQRTLENVLALEGVRKVFAVNDLV